MDRGAWWAIVQGVAKSWIQLKQFSTEAREWLGRIMGTAKSSEFGMTMQAKGLIWLIFLLSNV